MTGRFDLPHLLDQFFANAIQVWNFRLLAHPDAVVDHAAQIFGEVSVDFGEIVPSGSPSRTSIRESSPIGSAAANGTARLSQRYPAPAALLRMNSLRPIIYAPH